MELWGSGASMVGHKRFAQAEAGHATSQAGRRAVWSGRLSGRVIGLLLVVLLAGDSAWAQLNIQPMLLRLAVSPGRSYTQTLRLENSNPKEAETVTLRVAEMTQASDGAWTELMPEDPNTSQAVLRSCAAWLTVPAKDVTVGAYKIVPFTMRINVPAQTRGFYFAALVGTTAAKSMEMATGVVAPVKLQVVVWVILEVQSTPPPQNITLTDVGLGYQAQTVDTPAASHVTIDVANAGGTLSNLAPVARIWRQQQGHWTRITDVRFPEIMIMPGVKLHLTQDLSQMLPSGLYQVQAALTIDSRRGPVVKKTVPFAGDPAVQGDVRSLASLGVRPAALLADIIPGATRMVSFQVSNLSEENVTVRAEVILPEHMQGKQVGAAVRAEDLGCADWVAVNPASFVLQGYAQRSVTALIKTPQDATKYRNYYGTVRLHVSHADGTPGVTKDAFVCLQNPKVADTPRLVANILSTAELSPARYQVSAVFANSGTAYVNDVRCEGALSIVGLGGGGAAILKRFLLTSETLGQSGPLLPAGIRNFAGTLDLLDVPAGVYYVTAIVTWPGGPADGVQRQIAVRVDEQGGRKNVTNLGENTGPTVIKL